MYLPSLNASLKHGVPRAGKQDEFTLQSTTLVHAREILSYLLYADKLHDVDLHETQVPLMAVKT